MYLRFGSELLRSGEHVRLETAKLVIHPVQPTGKTCRNDEKNTSQTSASEKKKETRRCMFYDLEAALQKVILYTADISFLKT